ncbi:MAG: hypothetical protein HUJ68_09850 [Clostridia bacterium]|nr:hypothetical protein [Clostridia bacterium]
MSLSEWAENEVKIASEKEDDYGKLCYESALKAFKSLMDDGHSGMSFGITKNILIRLMEEKPLKPIEDTEDVWVKNLWEKDGKENCSYQCKRMSSLFKEIKDGKTTYHDVGRAVYREFNGHDWMTWGNGDVARLIDEMFPIIFPYYPPAGKYIVEGFSFDSVNAQPGEVDTKAYWTLKEPEGKIHKLNKFYIEKDEKWVETDFDEYKNRLFNYSKEIGDRDLYSNILNRILKD